ncbi:uncharacterized protein KY384_006300 [Bacidia gigantensis]|uniref:uncharacterized protein n=1 Tax=Bacidia gigantensis TaxID=2732470 RepID=UPI001D0371CE|nr:uncharacterized protein KY384_006300 [Bacidia gigantensis]KAG8528613.1 hypothetical protein KY384_006300 [Bacidia gigantensis]
MTEPVSRSNLTAINYGSDSEKADSDYQVHWTNIMSKRQYRSPLSYKKVAVLLLRWSDHCDDLGTKDEVEALADVFKTRFGYHTTIECLDNQDNNRVGINLVVASWVAAHNGPNINTLFIVYYAGHGKPGSVHGEIKLFGQSNPNDPNEAEQERNYLIWNGVEKLLKDADADVLEIFDWYVPSIKLQGKNLTPKAVTPKPWGSPEVAIGQCHDQIHTLEVKLTDTVRSFEYIAATRAKEATAVPGKNSFTSALIYALITLYEEKLPESRFTAVDILDTIRNRAPHFSKSQFPRLLNRITDKNPGRIMLHPLNPKETTEPPLANEQDILLEHAEKHTMTLHFDLAKKMNFDVLGIFGDQLNGIFDHHFLGVNNVRWGGMRPGPVGMVRERLHEMRRKKSSFDSGSPEQRRAALRLLTPNTGPLTSPYSPDSLNKSQQALISEPSTAPMTPLPETLGNEIGEPSRKRRRMEESSGEDLQHVGSQYN